VDQVYIALPWIARGRLQELIRQLELTPVRISLVSEPLGFDIPVRAIKYINNTPTLQLIHYPLSGWSNLIKWIEDRFLSLLILIFVSPLLVFIAIAIKLDSPGRVFFKQRRYGFNNNEIDVWKFRSMYVDNSAYVDNSGPNVPMRQATKNDVRVTRVGRFLRQSSLDELPQFINVFLGDMSIVGPRPHAVAHTYHGQKFEEIIARYAARHRVKPGITGWAQVNGWRGETDTVEKIEKRIEYDLHYIEHWSLWFDIWIIMKTMILIVKDENAY
jgi:Undecaprenyl-phosphate glucose phosphotransferase